MYRLGIDGRANRVRRDLVQPERLVANQCTRARSIHEARLNRFTDLAETFGGQAFQRPGLLALQLRERFDRRGRTQCFAGVGSDADNVKIIDKMAVVGLLMDLLAAKSAAEAMRLIAVVTASDQIPNSARAVSMRAKHFADVICLSKIPALKASGAF